MNDYYLVCDKCKKYILSWPKEGERGYKDGLEAIAFLMKHSNECLPDYVRVVSENVKSYLCTGYSYQLQKFSAEDIAEYPPLKFLKEEEAI
jgi:hypothetical protein